MKIKKESLALGIAILFAIFIFNNLIKKNSEGYKTSQNLNKVKSEIESEFDDSYSKNIEPSGKVKEFELIASEDEIEIFPGKLTKVWSYNHQVPGPEIHIKLGNTLRVKFTNNLPQETTIHWHGVRVPNAMDGVPGVTQEPVQPGESFVYEFTPKDAGTFWFHPHFQSSEQVERGLYGVLIVDDQYSDQYSQDIVWVLDDWRLLNDYQIDPRFNTAHDLMHDGRWGNLITVNSRINENVQVRPGERIRLRIINTSNGRIYAPYFEGLDAKIIAVDGLYTKKPLNANGFELAPGNRIDIDLKIPAKDKKYQIIDRFAAQANILGAISTEGKIAETPDFKYPGNLNIPDWKNADQIPIDKDYRLNAKAAGSMGMGMMGGIEWTINDKAFPDYDPFELKYNEFNKISFTNESYRLHPMHLHGQFFKVLSRNGQSVDEPYFRDTVLIHSKEIVEIGLIPLDKGKWVQHCHILEHAEAGMLTITNVQ